MFSKISVTFRATISNHHSTAELHLSSAFICMHYR